jgi:Lar family restriction alleviation protein
MMDELLPCPFCGENEVVTEMDHEQGTKWGYAICQYCCARGPETRTGYDASNDAPWRHEAIKLWNSRAAKIKPAQTVEGGDA